MMKFPVHPGELLREEVIAALQLSVTEAAERLGVSRVALSRVLNGRAGISPDLALRLERAGVSTARAWLAMQSNYDLAQAMKREQPPVRPLDDKGGMISENLA
ncbi:MAG TPA: addiction module antidote protein, HigA family [Agrobacterium sp.]|uniref:HigA family addiction module antitoxin n=1 Tax=Rhizobium TaxID=379 RepID=UPI000E9D1246|nr:addiction module antidote protein, HigA family [Agrobacterium sp.]